MNSKTYNTQLISILNHIFYNDFIKILVECGGNIPNNLNASIENQEKILVLILNLLCSFLPEIVDISILSSLSLRPQSSVTSSLELIYKIIKSIINAFLK